MKPEFSTKQRVADLIKHRRELSLMQIEEATGLSGAQVRRAISRLKFEDVIHRSGFIPPNGPGSPTPIFRFGAGKDVNYARKAPSPEKRREWKQRSRERARMRVLGYDPNRPISRDPFTAILFGACEAIQATALPSHVYRQAMNVEGDELEAA